VSKIQFSNISADYCRAILASLGSQLVSLKYLNCGQDIDLDTDLNLCPRTSRTRRVQFGTVWLCFHISIPTVSWIDRKGEEVLAEVEAELIMIISSTKFEIKIRLWVSFLK